MNQLINPLRCTLLLVMFQCFFFFTSLSQSFVTDFLGFEDGLLDVQCYDIFQDSDGYIWIGNRAGLNKYDGRDIISFNRSNGLIVDNIFSIHEDSQKRKWLINISGEPIFIKDDIVHDRYTDPYLEGLKSVLFMEQIFENSKGEVVFVCSNGVIRILTVDNRILIYDVSEYSENEIGDLYGVFEYNNSYYSLFRQGIYRFNQDFSEAELFFCWDEAFKITRKYLTKGIIYFSNGKTLYSFDLENRLLKEVHEFEDLRRFTDMRMVNDQLVISSDVGVFIYHNDTITKYPADLNESVSGLVIDSDGNEWYATLSSGVIQRTRIIVNSSQFDFIDSISYIQEMDSIIYVGDEKGKLYEVNREGDILNLFSSYDHENHQAVQATLYLDDKLWIRTSDYLFNSSGDYIRMFSRDILYNEHDGLLYVVSGSGVRLLEKSYLSNNRYLNDNDAIDLYKNSKLLPINQAYRILKDHKNVLWICSEDGLFQIKEKSIHKIKNNNLAGSITDIEMMDSLIFGINYSQGVFVYNMNSKQSFLYNEEQGLVSNNISSFTLDFPYIYSTHPRGISKMKYQEGRITKVNNYGRSHGVKRGVISYLAVVGDKLQFGIDSEAYELAFMEYTEDSLRVNVSCPNPSVYSDDEVVIDYECVDYTFGKDVDYEYVLHPLDSVWVSTSSESMVYRYLPPGNYTFEVKATHPLKLPVTSSSISFTIHNRWYTSKSMFMILGLILIIVSWFLFRIDVLNFSALKLKLWVAKYLGLDRKYQISIKDINGNVQLLESSQIYYIKASGNYVEYHTLNEKIVSRNTLIKAKQIIKKSSSLKQVHRSYIANLDRIDKISGKSIFINSKEIPYSSTYKEHIEKYLNLIKE